MKSARLDALRFIQFGSYTVPVSAIARIDWGHEDDDFEGRCVKVILLDKSFVIVSHEFIQGDDLTKASLSVFEGPFQKYINGNNGES